MKTVKGFVQFIREQGIVGLAIGFIIGTSMNKVVGSLVDDIIQPTVGLLFGSTEGLKSFHYQSIMIGSFLTSLLNFLILAAIVYLVFKGLRLERLDVKAQGGAAKK